MFWIMSITTVRSLRYYQTTALPLHTQADPLYNAFLWVTPPALSQVHPSLVHSSCVALEPELHPFASTSHTSLHHHQPFTFLRLGYRAPHNLPLLTPFPSYLPQLTSFLSHTCPHLPTDLPSHFSLRSLHVFHSSVHLTKFPPLAPLGLISGKPL